MRFLHGLGCRQVQIRCENVWKVYGAKASSDFRLGGERPDAAAVRDAGGFAAVADVSFEVRKGESLVIMGLSGSGKSTLLRCLCRLIEPSWGRISIDGLDVLGASARDLIELRRRRVGMVFQNFGLLPHRTVLSNVMLPLEVQKLPKAQALSKVQGVIELVGLAGMEARYPAQLSGGQQQRVGIARSLVTNPDIWFLDEPFSALDPLIRREMQDEFLRLQRQLRKTIVFVTHDFDEALRIADRICIMKDGRVVQLATPAELITRPADDYVQRFTENAPLASIVTAGDLGAEAVPQATAPEFVVPASARVSEIAADVLLHDRPVGIVDEELNLVALLDRAKLVAVLSNKRASV